jgi:hypothetical protein
MTQVAQTSKNFKANLAAQLDAAALACTGTHEHFPDWDPRAFAFPASYVVNDPQTPCPWCRRYQLERQYRAILDNETEDRAETLFQWAISDPAPAVRKAVIERYEQKLEAATIASVEMDLSSVTDEVSPRRAIEIVSDFERAERELDLARYEPGRKSHDKGKAH